MPNTQKHTPGPWKIETAPNRFGKDFTGVSTVCDFGHDQWANLALCANNGMNGDANARLIAAAPDLLEALKYAERMLDSYKTTHVGVHHAALEKARAAIAKAEGRG